SGEPMLVGSQQARFDGAPDPGDSARTAVRMTIGSTTHWLDAPALGGGSLAGTLRFRDEDLASAINQVGRIAQTVSAAVNSQQSLGIDMNGNAGPVLFSVPQPVSIAGAVNSGSGVLTTTITSAIALQPSDYDVSWDGSNYNVTRIADGASSAFPTLPATLDGLSIAASGAPAVGDHWRVQPFAAASTGMTARAINPREIATAFAATIQALTTNTGTGVASGFSIVRAAAANTLAVSITFNNPPTSYNVSGLSGGPLANVPFVAGQRVPASPADYNGWSVVLDGRPAAGDTFNVSPVTTPGADNRNALALAGLAKSGLVGGATLNEAYASALGDIGTRVQTGQAAADISSRLSDEAVSRQQNVSGVNLDEEAANLLRYQQMYQASAKIIQASQALFDALLAATNH
ncbi:MAG: hypothetical protein H7255_08585, partial [Ramlibacter sp.]|nr:hypothetical protein [Ramlibacter sp.]